MKESYATSCATIAAVVMAAGQSRRMGMPKLCLPWGDTTVIGQVVSTLLGAGLAEVVVVSGAARAAVEAALNGWGVRCVFNPRYEEDSMLLSLQTGLRSISPQSSAALVVLGDQPQMRLETVRSVIEEYLRQGAPLVVPSYRRRRGHPWLVARSLWPELLGLQPPLTLRDFLSRHPTEIAYVEALDDSILRDVDTLEEYESQRPREYPPDLTPPMGSR